MELRVDSAQLEDFARQVYRGAEDSREVLNYARKFTHISGEQMGLFAIAVEGHDGLRNGVLQALQRLSGILTESSEELRSAAAYYRRTDHAVAAVLDAGYPRERR
ncbi:type VII secretion target [Streptomyces sp. NPDC026206]|uniref:type VII secretion target n=1 Tax=Streptomyces sp. NPDC026206 TaxID=3157089 RepID=UPI0033DFBC1E